MSQTTRGGEEVRADRRRATATRWSLPLILLVACAAPPNGDPRQPSPASAATGDGEAERLVAAGLSDLETRRARDLQRAVEQLEAALELDPHNPVAWSGLADASALLGLYSVVPAAETMPRAAAAAERALALDPDLPRAHASLGLVRYLYDWSWSEAEAHFRRALKLDPDDATTHHWLAMMLTALGRSEEAVAQAERAVAAGAESRVVQIKAATVFAAAGRLERAERQLADCLQRFPDAALAHRELGYLRLRQGRLAEAIPAFERAAALAGGDSAEAGLGLAYALAGRAPDARRVLGALESVAAGEPRPWFDLALVHAGLDETDRAFESLEQALAARDPALVYLASKPGLDRLAADPRYRRLAERIGLPVS
ncbi:MAG TPA: tetratricopeptide repeat protein [Thermoanaerobaculia bacterium]|nr:tetratricopeptide repeat protein [Thermoanaerobaculia bacterium]